MTRRGLFALLAGVFGARKVPAVLKVGGTITFPCVYAVNPLTRVQTFQYFYFISSGPQVFRITEKLGDRW